MLTDNKEITTPEYWERIFTGKNDNAKVDASNLTRPKNTFDRFSWVAKYAEGPYVLGVASGHGHIEKRIKAANPNWTVIASDQTEAAKKASKYDMYFIFDAYEIPFIDKKFDTIIIAQALEYFEDRDRFLTEAKRVAKKIILTLPIGEMKLWSQLIIFTEENVMEMLSPYGKVEVWEMHDDLLLVKLKFG